MKYLYTTFTTIIAVGMFATASPVLAQTPDGDTPAQETVCDVLREDGVTKGLYGLCVAFCEAGDYADEADSITPEELLTLETSAPSGRILANYNKKKDRADNPLDPDMPCVQVQEPCPCWTADQLARVADGLLGGSPDPEVYCYEQVGSTYNYIYAYDLDFSSTFAVEQAIVYDYPDYHACYVELRVAGEMGYFSNLSVESGTLTTAEWDACNSAMKTHWDALTACEYGNHP